VFAAIPATIGADRRPSRTAGRTPAAPPGRSARRGRGAREAARAGAPAPRAAVRIRDRSATEC